MAIPVTLGVPTAGHSSATSAGRCSHVFPPSVDRNIAAGMGVPVPAYMMLGSEGLIATCHTHSPFITESTNCQFCPASSLRYSPFSVPVNTTLGLPGWFTMHRTSASECSPAPIPTRPHVSPLSPLRMIPCPTVPTRMLILSAICLHPPI